MLWGDWVYLPLLVCFCLCSKCCIVTKWQLGPTGLQLVSACEWLNWQRCAIAGTGWVFRVLLSASILLGFDNNLIAVSMNQPRSWLRILKLTASKRMTFLGFFFIRLKETYDAQKGIALLLKYPVKDVLNSKKKTFPCLYNPDPLLRSQTVMKLIE